MSFSLQVAASRLGHHVSTGMRSLSSSEETELLEVVESALASVGPDREDSLGRLQAEEGQGLIVFLLDRAKGRERGPLPAINGSEVPGTLPPASKTLSILAQALTCRAPCAPQEEEIAALGQNHPDMGEIPLARGPNVPVLNKKHPAPGKSTAPPVGAPVSRLQWSP
ncbi:unnamed protein product, partial [Discosporangium mesarthrocarpum]